MQKIEINKKISIFQIQDRDLFTTLICTVFIQQFEFIDKMLCESRLLAPSRHQCEKI